MAKRRFTCPQCGYRFFSIWYGDGDNALEIRCLRCFSGEKEAQGIEIVPAYHPDPNEEED